MNSFRDFGLAETITRALAEERYETPTPIQAQTIPVAMQGRDVIGIAQTGTGKTAAFALPILHRLSLDPRRPERKSARVLVLSPTRELSGQILDSFRTYGRHQRIGATLAIGGVPIGRQQRALANGVDVLVATPGRLLDLVNTRALTLDLVKCLVLDEADRMLDMGFIHDVKRIVSKLPRDRQTLFFSATMPQAIAELAQQMLRDPARIAVTPVAKTADRVAQRVIHVDHGAKANVLADLLKAEPVDRALVFTRTKHGADKVVRILEREGIAAHAIHGNKSQNQRERVLAAFRKGEVRTLVATDIAARGIDVDGISHVVNFDLPNVPETYVHRIGRTARAGAEGVAISLCVPDEVVYLRDIEKLIRLTIPSTNQRERHAGGAQPQIQRSHGNGDRPHGVNPQGQGQRNPKAHGYGANRHGDRPRHHGGGRPNHGEEGRPHQHGETRPQRHHHHGESRPQQKDASLANHHGEGRQRPPHGEGRRHGGGGRVWRGRPQRSRVVA